MVCINPRIEDAEVVACCDEGDKARNENNALVIFVHREERNQRYMVVATMLASALTES